MSNHEFKPVDLTKARQYQESSGIRKKNSGDKLPFIRFNENGYLDLFRQAIEQWRAQCFQ